MEPPELASAAECLLSRHNWSAVAARIISAMQVHSQSR
jgi:hypothetical protein